MKIIPGSQQASLAAQTAEKDEKTAASSKKQAAARTPRTADQVDFSASLSTGPKSQQEQANRVESIKSLVKAGTYQVSSREVAEKMLATFPDLAR
jgi:flagellar biosynthesis anti-sigma factor FlgM